MAHDWRQRVKDRRLDLSGRADHCGLRRHTVGNGVQSDPDYPPLTAQLG